MDIKEHLVSGNTENKQNHPWEYARRQVIFTLLSKYLCADNNNKSMVDVGCGDLFFLNGFYNKYNKYAPIAVDTAFDDNLTETIKSNYPKLPVQLYSDVNDISSNTPTAQVIFLMDVIEHIEDDVQFVRDLSKKHFVDNNTIFMITVPAFNSLYCSHDKWLGHYRRYSKKSLQKCVESAGLSIVDHGYFFSSLIIPRLIQKCMDKKNTNVEGIGNWNKGRFVSQLYKNILLCDFYFLRLFHYLGIDIPGLSTYSICKRQS